MKILLAVCRKRHLYSIGKVYLEGNLVEPIKTLIRMIIKNLYEKKTHTYVSRCI